MKMVRRTITVIGEAADVDRTMSHSLSGITEIIPGRLWVQVVPLSVEMIDAADVHSLVSDAHGLDREPAEDYWTP